ncbi:hypothetical protein BIW11_13732 [Tropilaelaps mercedesae]|uniref:Uncharacterized protein n=1 Tax=Tropilaelaps mercedesae TaxID=418985 RepID=A0A1V9X0K2_9ACAR|nr:hypothetical protein BIW11_13732 [Tropilaelaps mercedesae]
MCFWRVLTVLATLILVQAAPRHGKGVNMNPDNPQEIEANYLYSEHTRVVHVPDNDEAKLMTEADLRQNVKDFFLEQQEILSETAMPPDRNVDLIEDGFPTMGTENRGGHGEDEATLDSFMDEKGRQGDFPAPVDGRPQELEDPAPAMADGTSVASDIGRTSTTTNTAASSDVVPDNSPNPVSSGQNVTEALSTLPPGEKTLPEHTEDLDVDSPEADSDASTESVDGALDSAIDELPVGLTTESLTNGPGSPERPGMHKPTGVPQDGTSTDNPEFSIFVSTDNANQTSPEAQPTKQPDQPGNQANQATKPIKQPGNRTNQATRPTRPTRQPSQPDNPDVLNSESSLDEDEQKTEPLVSSRPHIAAVGSDPDSSDMDTTCQSVACQQNVFADTDEKTLDESDEEIVNAGLQNNEHTENPEEGSACSVPGRPDCVHLIQNAVVYGPFKIPGLAKYLSGTGQEVIVNINGKKIPGVFYGPFKAKLKFQSSTSATSD